MAYFDSSTPFHRFPAKQIAGCYYNCLQTHCKPAGESTDITVCIRTKADALCQIPSSWLIIILFCVLRVKRYFAPYDAYELLRCEAAPAILQTFEIR